eukprot:TRINITY_DN536_c0_g1_i1.p1 TRINITY_DN536_c0_g1~~TRINITY_DN536_c0_g1_i1.p1  ORF type:complete len:405 (-),score=201.98 TRINITY_DN536_c0_g1_i1:42-1256(-)
MSEIELEAIKYIEEQAKGGKWPIATPPMIIEAYKNKPNNNNNNNNDNSLNQNLFNDNCSSLFGFPPKIEGPTAWFGQDFEQNEHKWIYHLTQNDINELKFAVQYFINNNFELKKLTEPNAKDLFPLKNFGQFLQSSKSNQLVNGPGIWLLRGFPITQYNAIERSVLFLGIGAHIGQPVSQNAKGHLLGHVKDIGHDPAHPDTRIYATNQRQWFHSDECDVVGLLCIQVSEQGGESSVVSSHTIYNHLAETRPDLLAILCSQFFRDRKNEIPAGKLAYFASPVYYNYSNRIISFFDRNFLIRSHRLQGVKPLSVQQWEALDALEHFANHFALKMILQPGDMQFVHNHSIFHAREQYTDSDQKRRHLLRLWISISDHWEMPQELRDELRTGVLLSGINPCVPLEAE